MNFIRVLPAAMFMAAALCFGDAQAQTIPKRELSKDDNYPEPVLPDLSDEDGKQVKRMKNRFCAEASSDSDLTGYREYVPQKLGTGDWENPATKAALKNYFATYQDRLTCWAAKGRGIDVSVVKAAIAGSHREMFDDLVKSVGVPLNHIDASDGRTALDYVIDLANFDPFAGVDRQFLEYAYSTLIENGAKTRKQLEQDNSANSPEQKAREALATLNQKAKTGDLAAMYDLAFMYREGRYMPVDVKKSDYWFDEAERRATSANNADYIFQLGRSIYPGIHTPIFPVQKERALKLLRLAATLGQESANFFLGRAYLNGDAGPPNPSLALSYLERSDENNPIYPLWVGIAYDTSGDFETAAYHFRDMPALHTIPTLGINIAGWFKVRRVNPCGPSKVFPKGNC